ncbi:MAG: amidase domain-containing protein [Syntrophomonadaceae bacterium]|nr:amidase domain-containing protein [Fastidiosipila sp.]
MAILKKIPLFVLISLLLLLFQTAIASASTAQSTPEETAEMFLETRMQSLVTQNADDIVPFFAESEEAELYLLFNQNELLSMYLIPMAESNYKYENVVPKVLINSINVTGNTAVVDATLFSEMLWNAANPTGKGITSHISEDHLLTLIEQNGVWYINTDDYNCELGNAKQIDNNKKAILSAEVKKLQDEAKQKIEKANISQPMKIEFSNTNIDQSVASTRAAYNREGSQAYADNYWYNFNPAYKDMSSNGGGGDCTNFVSQCIRAGGASNDKIGSYKWWYDNKGTSSTSDDTWEWTWGTVSGLNYALKGNYTQSEYGPKAYEIVIQGDSNYNYSWGNQIQLGDVIQYENSSGLYHSVIVTGFVIQYYNGEAYSNPLISQHSSSKHNVSWQKSAYKTHFLFMTGVN